MLEGNCVADGSDVWIVYALSDQAAQNSHDLVPRDTHLRLAHSGDHGATFDARTTIEDPSAGAFFLLPRLASEGGGTLDVTYYAGTGEGDANATYRRARSTHKGKTFAPSVAIRKPETFTLKRTTSAWLGDYMATTWSGGNLYSAFVDNSSAAGHVAFFHQAVP